MRRSLVAEKPIKPPKELKKFFDDPPLIGDERREDYDNLFLMLAIAVRPADAIEWVYFADIVNLTWEIRRMRGIKAAMINSTIETRKADRLRTAAFLQGLSEDEELVEEEEGDEAGSECSADLLVDAYKYDMEALDGIDRQIASAEMRRNLAVRELAWHNETRARKLEKVSREIIDGEFSEAAE
jgi:hypothetical protein